MHPTPNAHRADAVVVVVGTRPEAVKLAAVTRVLGSRARVLHTGQHHDRNMWDKVVGDLTLPAPAHSVSLGALTRGEQIGTATRAIAEYLHVNRPAAIIVQGDTNSTLAGALAGNATQTCVVHVEAGLRNDDRTMPEESNRRLTDCIADVCCVPHPSNMARLLAENISEERIFLTGNTLAETFYEILPSVEARSVILRSWGLNHRGYVLATVHRARTVDDPRLLRNVLEALGQLSKRVPVVFPVHPHTRKSVAMHGMDDLLRPFRACAPLGPSEFMALEAGAAMVCSDSGGVQEETAMLRVPLVILRDSTERPELLGTFCRLVGTDDTARRLEQAWDDVPLWTASLSLAELPYDNSNAATRIVAAMNAVLRRS